MANLIENILSELADALDVTHAFRSVTVGQREDLTEVPRAEVQLEGNEYFRADDQAAVRWGRLQVRIRLLCRTAAPADRTVRAGQLLTTAADALLTDPTRDGLCCNLPIGRATELGRAELRDSGAEVRLSLRCHYEIPEEA